MTRSLLTAVDHGDRLDEMQGRLDGATASGATTIAHYEFDTIDVSLLVPFGQQTGLSLGLHGRGTVTEERYAADGTLLDRHSSPFDQTFAMRQATASALDARRRAAAARMSTLPDLRRRARIGIVGCGDVAHRWYLPALAEMADRVELVAACDPRREAAEAVAAAAESWSPGAAVHTELDRVPGRIGAGRGDQPEPGAGPRIGQPAMPGGRRAMSIRRSRWPARWPRRIG